MTADTVHVRGATPRLLRSLTLTHAVLYGLGVTVGAGLYVLVGVAVICPLQSGPSTILVWTLKEKENGQETRA